MARKLGYHWAARGTGWELRRDVAWWQAAGVEEARAGEEARRQLAQMARLYEEHAAKDPEALERVRDQAQHDLERESDLAARHRLRRLRRVAGDLTDPTVRNFMTVYRRMTPEMRADVAAGKTASIRVDAKGPADEAIAYEVQVRQVVEGRRAALLFRAPEAVYLDGQPSERVILEWRLETLPEADQRPTTDELLQRRVSFTLAERAAAAECDPGRGAAASPGPPVSVERTAPGKVTVRWETPLRPTIAAFAQAVALAADVGVIADGYTRAVTIPPQQGAPLARLLAEFCERNDYRWECADGRIILRSASPLLERRREVPERHVRGWRTAPRQQGQLSLATMVEIAATLSDDQLEPFEARWPLYAGRPEAFASICGGLSPWFSRAGLRFYASLAESQRREAASGGLAFARMLPEQQRLFAAVFAEDPRTGQFATASPAAIAAGAFRIGSSTRTVLLAGRGSRDWEPADPDLEESIRERRTSGAPPLADGRVPATLTRLQFAFHIGSQQAPRVLFEYAEPPVPL
jgi:hypothetical protein